MFPPPPAMDFFGLLGRCMQSQTLSMNGYEGLRCCLCSVHGADTNSIVLAPCEITFCFPGLLSGQNPALETRSSTERCEGGVRGLG